MPQKILVINPYVTDFKLYDEWMHPLGLYFLLHLLRSREVDALYFDCLNTHGKRTRKYGTGDIESREVTKPDLYSSIKRKYKVYGRPEKEFESFLSEIPPPDLICIGTMMTYWAPGVLKTAQIIRKFLPDVPIVFGGIAARLMPSFFSSAIVNCSIAGDVHSGSTMKMLRVSARPGLPFSYLRGLEFLTSARHGPILLSLGCPLRCSYCASSVLQPGHLCRQVETIINEVTYMAEHFGVIDFAFYDDALLYEPQTALIPFLKGIKETGLKLRFHTPNGLHLRFLTEPLLMLLKESGFTTLRFGYESGQLKHSHATAAKAGRKELVSKVALAKSAGFSKDQIGIYLMGGLKGQTAIEMMEEIDFVKASGAKVKPVFLSPVPGTPLFEYYAKQFPSLRYDPLWHNDSFFITCIPGWDWDTLEVIRRQARES